MPTFGSHVIPGSITREVGLIEIWIERKNLVLLGGSGLISSFTEKAQSQELAYLPQLLVSSFDHACHSAASRTLTYTTRHVALAATGTDPRAVDRALTTPMRFSAPAVMDGEGTALEVTGECQPRKPLEMIGVCGRLRGDDGR